MDPFEAFDMAHEETTSSLSTTSRSNQPLPTSSISKRHVHSSHSQVPSHSLASHTQSAHAHRIPPSSRHHSTHEQQSPRKEKVEILKTMLPNVPREILRDYLHEAGGSIQKATDLYFYSSKKLEEISSSQHSKGPNSTNKRTIQLSQPSPTTPTTTTSARIRDEFPDDDELEEIRTGRKRRLFTSPSRGSPPNPSKLPRIIMDDEEEERAVVVGDDEEESCSSEGSQKAPITLLSDSEDEKEEEQTNDDEDSEPVARRSLYHTKASGRRTSIDDSSFSTLDDRLSKENRMLARRRIADIVGSEFSDAKIDEFLCLHDGDIVMTVDACLNYKEMMNKAAAISADASYSSTSSSSTQRRMSSTQTADEKIRELKRLPDVQRRLQLKKTVDGWPKPLGEMIVTCHPVGKNGSSYQRGAKVCFSFPHHDTDNILVFDEDKRQIGYFDSFYSETLAPLVRRKVVTLTGVIFSSHRAGEFEVLSRVWMRKEAASNQNEIENINNLNGESKKTFLRRKPMDALFNNLRSTASIKSANVSKQNEEDLQALTRLGFQSLIPAPAKLKEHQPASTLITKLHAYQRQALWWMIRREQGKTDEEIQSSQGSQGSTAKRKPPMHPLFEKRTFQQEEELCNEEEDKKQKRPLVIVLDDDEDEEERTLKKEKKPDKFYYNVYTGEIRFDRPPLPTPPLGGILADEQGLGKTIQMLALILTNTEDLATSPPRPDVSYLSSKRVYNPTLIVVPVSLLHQWNQEIRKHVTPGILKVYTHYGQDKASQMEELSRSHIVLTTYTTLAKEFEDSEENSGEEKIRKKKGFTYDHVLKKKAKKKSGVLLQVNWYRVILDEAHLIRTKETLTARACFALKAKRRWCLSGTPIQNKLADLYSLFRFLRLEPFGDFNWWNQAVQIPFENRCPIAATNLKTALRSVLLRRIKSDVLNVNEETSLPPLNVEIVKMPFSKEEQTLYDALLHRSRIRIDNFIKQGTIKNNYACMFELLLRLRQACNHPFIVLRSLASSNKQEEQDLREFLANKENASGSSPFLENVFNNLSNSESSQDLGECSICYEYMENPVVTVCGHVFCEECLNTFMAPTYFEGKKVGCPICRKELSHLDVKSLTTSTKFDDDDMKTHWKPSTKTKALLTELETVLEDPDARCVVFSQFTSMLDVASIALKNAKISFLRLDGQLSQKKRERVIQDFYRSDDSRVLLISTKAGGLGLNLTCANHVFILDPWWNPAVEMQAIDRVHRLGQKKPVVAKRFIIADSVEEKILKLQEEKKAIVFSTLGHPSSSSSSSSSSSTSSSLASMALDDLDGGDAGLVMMRGGNGANLPANPTRLTLQELTGLFN